MTPLAVSVWMTRARLTGQGSDGAGPLPAVFAGVFRSFIAFVQGMSAFADSIGVARTGGAGQRLDARKSVSAVFAVELRHDERFLFVVVGGNWGLRPQSGLSDVLLCVPGADGLSGCGGTRPPGCFGEPHPMKTVTAVPESRRNRGERDWGIRTDCGGLRRKKAV